MSYSTTRQRVQNKLLEMCERIVGPVSQSEYKVKTFDKYLHDVPIEEMPYVVVNVRQVEQTPGEIGILRELEAWTVHIYYLDISDDYNEGEFRRDRIVHLIQETIEQEPTLEGLRLPQYDEDGNAPYTEYVFDSGFESAMFDASGQDGYYTFVAELYFTVNIAKN